jgi:hypothetical protein
MMLGLAEFEAALKKVAAEADEAARATVSKAAALAEAGAKGNFAGSHKKGEPRVQASVGGHPAPNVVTGNLRRSIRTDPIKRFGLGDYGTIVAPRAIYSRAVELGRHPGSAAYPFFEPAARLVRPRFGEIAAQQWSKFLRF